MIFRFLHKDGILDDHLLLTKKSPLDELNKEDLLADPRKPKSGTRRSRSYYPVTLPTELSSTEPNKGACYIYRYQFRKVTSMIFAINFLVFFSSFFVQKSSEISV